MAQPFVDPCSLGVIDAEPSGLGRWRLDRQIYRANLERMVAQCVSTT